MKLSGNLSHSRYEWAEKCLSKLLPIAPSSVVSDMGAGTGDMRFRVESAGGQWQGFDQSPKLPEIYPWNLDNTAPNGCESAGVILLLDVLEHLNNPWLAMRNLVDALLPGGFLILTVPNPRWSRSRCYALAQGNLLCFTQSDLDLNHHVFTPWPHIVEDLLTETGLTIKDYVTLDGSTVFPKIAFNTRYPSRWMFALLNRAIERYDPTACGMSYGILAQKRV